MKPAVRVSAITPCYRGAAYLEGFLASVASQTVLEELQIVLDHNDPTPAELELVGDFQRQHPGRLKHIVTTPVQPIGASMNECLLNADGEFVAIWNVDDLRTDDSLERQCTALEAAPEAGFAYGDFLVVPTFGEREGPRVSPPAFDREEFTRSMHLGPFFMWRRDLTSRTGLFDEQLRSGADFDLAIRLALLTEGVHADGLLGYYLDAGLGASTRAGSLQAVERTVIELRYGIYDKLDYDYAPQAREYRRDMLLQQGTWVPIATILPSYAELLARREALRAIGLRNHRRRSRARLRALPLVAMRRAASLARRIVRAPGKTLQPAAHTRRAK